MKRRWGWSELSMLTLLTAIQACSVNGDDVRRHAEAWKSKKIDSYVFVWFQGCFCEVPDFDGVRVEVRDNVPRSAFGVGKGLPFPSQAVTIDSIFDLVAGAADGNPDELEVQYDSKNGFITRAHVQQDTRAEDDGFVIETRCFSREIETGCPITTLTSK